MGAIVVLKFPSERTRKPAVGSPVNSGAVVLMARESTKRKPAERIAKKRVRYVPDWKPLREKWDELKDPRHLSQKQMGAMANASEGAISQLLNGSTKLTIEWALQFAMYMRVPITEIWPEFPFAHLVPGNLAPDEVEVALMFRMLQEPRKKKAFAEFLRTLQSAG